MCESQWFNAVYFFSEKAPEKLWVDQNSEKSRRDSGKKPLNKTPTAKQFVAQWVEKELFKNEQKANDELWRAKHKRSSFKLGGGEKNAARVSALCGGNICSTLKL